MDDESDVMVADSMLGDMNDDPRKLRGILDRACVLAREHAVPSVMLGIAGGEGDLRFPEFVAYLQSELRVEDAIFRMTRERAVVYLADLDCTRGQEVLDRLSAGFNEEYPATSPLDYEVRYFEVKPGASKLRVKDMLTQIFPPPPE
jgi:hypothetical protein